MAAAPALSDYDYHIKLFLIGDRGVGKRSLLLRFSVAPFDTSFFSRMMEIFSKTRTIELDGKHIKLQIRNTTDEERLTVINNACYQRDVGILLVYDVTNEASFNNIKTCLRNIEQHAASDNVKKILVGNKADKDESKRAVPAVKGQALADEYGIKFFETSARTCLNVEQAFFSMTKDVKQRL